MCTIVVRQSEGRLVVAANRDELLGRAWIAPHEVRPGIVAGIDRLRGGSWMGANRHGLFVAITNQRAYTSPRPLATSRGEIVLEALEERDAEGVAKRLAAIRPADHNAFNLIFGTPGDVRVAYARPEHDAIEVVRPDQASIVLANDRLHSVDFPKIARAEALATDDAMTMEVVLGDHDKPPIEKVPAPPPHALYTHTLARELQAICIHTPAYGTVSATVLAYEDSRLVSYRFAPGPPCVTPFEDVALPGA